MTLSQRLKNIGLALGLVGILSNPAVANEKPSSQPALRLAPKSECSAETYCIEDLQKFIKEYENPEGILCEFGRENGLFGTIGAVESPKNCGKPTGRVVYRNYQFGNLVYDVPEHANLIFLNMICRANEKITMPISAAQKTYNTQKELCKDLGGDITSAAVVAAYEEAFGSNLKKIFNLYDINQDEKIDISDDLNWDNVITAEDAELYKKQTTRQK